MPGDCTSGAGRGRIRSWPTQKSLDDRSWRPKQIAHYLDVSERHVRDVRREDETFPPRMAGREPRWSRDVSRR